MSKSDQATKSKDRDEVMLHMGFFKGQQSDFSFLKQTFCMPSPLHDFVLSELWLYEARFPLVKLLSAVGPNSAPHIALLTLSFHFPQCPTAGKAIKS